MIQKNTFLIKQTEKLDSEKIFVSLLCPQLLGYIKKSYFDTILMINSAPGGGKSTLLHTFSPEILTEIQKNASKKDKYTDIYKMLSELGVIGENKINLLSITISCARENYSLIEDVYETGKSTSLFFQLISLRICTKMLVTIKNFSGVDSLEDITFSNVPDNWKALLQNNANGQFLYDWAFEEEGKLCNLIDNMDESAKGTMMFNNMSVLQLFENGNVLINRVPMEQKILVTFDDIHALTLNQREELRNCIFRLRPNLSIWMTQRLIALSEEEIFGTEGKLHREYEVINLDENMKESKTFNSALKNVANRRVSITYRDEGIEDKLDPYPYKNLKEKIDSSIEKLKKEILKECSENENYDNIIQYIESQKDVEPIELAKMLRVLLILIYRQKNKPQFVLTMVNVMTIDEFKKEYNKTKGIAEFYFCSENKIPVYYGLRALQYLSFYNIEQFLEFSGEIFEARIALDYTSKKKKSDYLTAKEQEQIIVNYAEEKWQNIRKSFAEGEEIQRFLKNIAKIGIRSMNGKKASYPGGALTGIGIEEEKMRQIINNDKWDKCIQLLKICIANNYLNYWNIKQGQVDRNNKVLYLNRWICVKFRLPLEYGGWKPISQHILLELLNTGVDE